MEAATHTRYEYPCKCATCPSGMYGRAGGWGFLGGYGCETYNSGDYDADVITLRIDFPDNL